MICISLGNISYIDAIDIAQVAELIEIRADLLDFDKNQFSNLIKSAKKVIFTCRPESLAKKERELLFEYAISEGVDYIDIEIESDEKEILALKEKLIGEKTELIISYHNYSSTPPKDELSILLKKCYKLGADVVKIATMIQKDEDMVDLLSLYRKHGRKVILGMGEKGILTRVAALAFGAEFSFAAPDNGHATAPGQLRLSEMQDLLRIMKI